MFIIAYSTEAIHVTGAKGYIITLRLEQDGSILPMNGSKKQFAVPEGETL
jgi:hypothetical protein